MYTAVICACLMSLRPLVVRWFPKIFPTTKNASVHGSQSHNATWGNRMSKKFQRVPKGAQLLSGDEMTSHHRDQKISVTKEFSVTESTEEPSLELEMRSPRYPMDKPVSYFDVEKGARVLTKSRPPF